MSEFDEYLARIRSALEVKPRRAGEICAEVRSHLEERTAQLVESGMSRDEAVAKAAQTFGDPHNVARRLTDANSRHRGVSAPGLALCLALAFVGMVAAFGVVESYDPFFWAVAGPGDSERVPWTFGFRIVVAALLAAPVMLMAGMAAGRRHWWIAFLPPSLWGLALLAVATFEGMPASYYVIPAALAILGAAPLAAAFAFLGSRVPQRRSARYLVAALGAAYLGVLLVRFLLEIGAHREAWLLGYVGAGEWLVLLVPGTAALWQWSKPPRRAAIVATAACAVFLFALHYTLAGVTETVFLRSQLIWMLRGIVAAQTAMAIALGAAVLARKRALRQDLDGATPAS